MTAALVWFGDGDVLTPIINSVTPGIAVLVIFAIAMTIMVLKVNGVAKGLKELSARVVTREDLRTMRLELREELDTRYDARFQRRPDYFTPAAHAAGD